VGVEYKFGIAIVARINVGRKEAGEVESPSKAFTAINVWTIALAKKLFSSMTVTSEVINSGKT
jgi:hypothetical protein